MTTTTQKVVSEIQISASAIARYLREMSDGLKRAGSHKHISPQSGSIADSAHSSSAIGVEAGETGGTLKRSTITSSTT